MSSSGFVIDPDIRRAHTPPPHIYSDAAVYELQRDAVFARAWHFVGDARQVRTPGSVVPHVLLPGCLDEPVVLTCDDDSSVHCLSNVCTHRGTIVVEGSGHVRHLRCRYHGRRFALDGTMTHMPEFDDVVDFPSPADNLPRLHTARWGPLLFASIDPLCTFDEWIAPVRDRVAFIPFDSYEPDASYTQDYAIRANWAMYCENYLEGFHVPYVHGASLTGLDYGAYTTELFDWCNLQKGIGRKGEPAFDIPEGHRDHGEHVVAYYFWLFPNFMVNVYPGFISLNIVRPETPQRTRVTFLRYVEPGAPLYEGSVAADLHRVEMEDEEIVESAQQGSRARLYRGGRYSPAREQGTHHFHQLLARSMGSGGAAPPR
ncbi:MAG TPA: SRPBCC family protein [Longimicrobiales bacterium]|nr:SRPBCC family protein [Longimicrobiales bacterium]